MRGVTAGATSGQGVGGGARVRLSRREELRFDAILWLGV